MQFVSQILLNPVFKCKINTGTEAFSQIHPEGPMVPRNVSGLKPTFEVLMRIKTQLKAGGVLREMLSDMIRFCFEK